MTALLLTGNQETFDFVSVQKIIFKPVTRTDKLRIVSISENSGLWIPLIYLKSPNDINYRYFFLLIFSFILKSKKFHINW